MSRKNSCRSNCKKTCCAEPTIFDYVIVGAGTAGAALAKLLTDNCHMSVLVIEGGQDRNTDPKVLSADGDVLDPFPAYHWYYPSANYPNTVPVTYTEGRMWGGSSGHNYLLAVRGTPVPYNEWGLVDPQWSYNNLLPVMKYLETYTPFVPPLNPTQRGTDGPLFVTGGLVNTFGVSNPISPTDPFVLATQTATSSVYTTDYNDIDQGALVVGDTEYYRTPEPQGVTTRSWSSSAFLGPDVARPDANGDGKGVGSRQLWITSSSVALKILFGDDPDARNNRALLSPPGDVLQASGVLYTKNGKSLKAFARRKVILCAGSIGDALLLQRSGIGPQALLDSVGIPVRLANDNVGRSAQNHYGPVVIMAANPASDPFAFTTSFYDRAGTNIGPGDGTRHYQSINLPGLAGPGTIGLLSVLVKPSRTVTVEVQAKAIPSDPLISFNFYSDPNDLAEAVDLLKLMANISIANTGTLPFVPDASAYPAAEYGAYGGTAPDNSQLEAFLFATSGPFNHNSGTCRMATSTADGVVDGNLDVFGVRHLSVCSNAVIPTILDGNTAYGAYVVGIQKAKIEGAYVPGT